ncbi:MAG TPA: VOC family protein [Methyloceanibacter sp.]|nr:VOC family protein [Methyloceanibacter sp.]
MKPAFTHCALHVRDLDRSIAFYRSYCGLELVNEHGKGNSRTVWLASPGAERNFVLVLLGGGPAHAQEDGDMTHYGFGVPAREDVDRIAERARADGCLHWEPREYAPPTGYLCAVKDPSGHIIEFSHGQPLGPHQD